MGLTFFAKQVRSKHELSSRRPSTIHPRGRAWNLVCSGTGKGCPRESRHTIACKARSCLRCSIGTPDHPWVEPDRRRRHIPVLWKATPGNCRRVKQRVNRKNQWAKWLGASGSQSIHRTNVDRTEPCRIARKTSRHSR